MEVLFFRQFRALQIMDLADVVYRRSIRSIFDTRMEKCRSKRKKFGGLPPVRTRAFKYDFRLAQRNPKPDSRGNSDGAHRIELPVGAGWVRIGLNDGQRLRR